MTHSLLIIGPLSILPRLPRLDIWWRRLRGGLGVAVKACISLLWLAGWDPFNLVGLLQGPPPLLLPLFPPQQLHNSALWPFQGGYQLCTGRRGLVQTTQLICMHVPREAHEHSGLHLFCIKPGSPITQARLHPLSMLWVDQLRTTALPIGLSFLWFTDFISHSLFTGTLWQCK